MRGSLFMTGEDVMDGVLQHGVMYGHDGTTRIPKNHLYTFTKHTFP
jgi:hypothetical protein